MIFIDNKKKNQLTQFEHISEMLFHSYFGAINTLDTSFGQIGSHSIGTCNKSSAINCKMVENIDSNVEGIFYISSTLHKGDSWFLLNETVNGFEYVSK